MTGRQHKIKQHRHTKSLQYINPGPGTKTSSSELSGILREDAALISGGGGCCSKDGEGCDREEGTHFLSLTRGQYLNREELECTYCASTFWVSRNDWRCNKWSLRYPDPIYGNMGLYRL